jgi:hypothetical protein
MLEKIRVFRSLNRFPLQEIFDLGDGLLPAPMLTSLLYNTLDRGFLP